MPAGMGLMFPRILFYVTTILQKKKILKIHFKDATRLFSLLRQLTVRQHITVKSTPKELRRPQKITSPLALTLLNYEEPMTKLVGIQTNNTLFEWLDHDYSRYHINYGKKIISLQSKIQKYSTQIQELKKEICSSNTTLQELKSNKFLLTKNQR